MCYLLDTRHSWEEFMQTYLVRAVDTVGRPKVHRWNLTERDHEKATKQLEFANFRKPVCSPYWQEQIIILNTLAFVILKYFLNKVIDEQEGNVQKHLSDVRSYAPNASSQWKTKNRKTQQGKRVKIITACQPLLLYSLCLMVFHLYYIHLF